MVDFGHQFLFRMSVLPSLDVTVLSKIHSLLALSYLNGNYSKKALPHIAAVTNYLDHLHKSLGSVITSSGSYKAMHSE